MGGWCDARAVADMLSEHRLGLRFLCVLVLLHMLWLWGPPIGAHCPSAGPSLGTSWFPATGRVHVVRGLQTWSTFGYVPFDKGEGRKDVREAQYELKVDGELLGNAAKRYGLKRVSDAARADFVVMSYRALGQRIRVDVPPGFTRTLSFCTVAAPRALPKSGKFMYEVRFTQLGRAPQIGWVQQAAFKHSVGKHTSLGVGDERDSWGVDGKRGKVWRGGGLSWSTRWVDGDVIGIAVNLNTGNMMAGRNGRWETVFTAVSGSLVAALSTKNAVFQVNFKGPFLYPPPGGVYSPAFAGDGLQLLRGNPSALHGVGASHGVEFDVADSIFAGVASDGGPRVVSQFPLVPGLASLAAASGVCSLEDKASMAECLEEAPGGRPRGVPHARVVRNRRTSRASLTEWASEVEKDCGGPVRWIAKDCRHGTGGRGVEIFQNISAAANYAAALLARAPPARTSASIARSNCVLVQRFVSKTLLVPWGPYGRSDAAGRRFSLRVYAVLASLSPLVVYWNPSASAVMLAAQSSQNQGKLGLVNDWRGTHRRTWAQLMRLLHSSKRGRHAKWRRSDVALLVPRIGSLLHSVLSVHNATTQRAGSFYMLACDLLLGPTLQPHYVECNLEGSSRRVDEGLAMIERLFDMITFPEVCARSTIGNWHLCEPLTAR
eukprot:TRINITY_DN3944_c1_g1_i1.p1 TRINITY_DN3944_c1_g1~~TRINITY_DN3944_c1_g1_i1.p1  ORF type:complete len:660 (+),score=115.67 TRINITY_DN3944_c1_g1_i1:29-2008(+)